MTAWPRGALWLHAALAAGAVAAFVWLPPPRLGLAILALVIAYNLALPLWAAAGGHRAWLQAWALVLPVSLCQLLADAALVNATQSLSFPDLGAPRWLGVPVYMALMWTIPLLWIAMAQRWWSALLVTLGVFGLAELLAAPLRLWVAAGVHTSFGAALYVLPAELLLGALVWRQARRSAGASWPARLATGAGISLCYTGALLWSWLLIERW